MRDPLDHDCDCGLDWDWDKVKVCPESLLTIAEVEKELGDTADKWAGRCMEVATAAAKVLKRKKKPGTAVYGHYNGEVRTGSMFYGRPVIQHGWVSLSSGWVLDPTRWEFECVEPYLYMGPAAAEYDEGGNDFRTQRMGSPPPFNPQGTVHDIKGMISQGCEDWLAAMLDLDVPDPVRPNQWERLSPVCRVTTQQLFWLGNRDPRSMKGFHQEVYDLLKELGMKGFIPLDNQLMIEQGRV